MKETRVLIRQVTLVKGETVMDLSCFRRSGKGEGQQAEENRIATSINLVIDILRNEECNFT